MQSLAIFVLALFAAGAVGAQAVAAPAPADGAMAIGAQGQATAIRSAPGPQTAMEVQAKRATAPSAYRSPFADYQRWREPDPVSWRVANDEAAAIGEPLGQHGGHAMGAMEAPPAAAASGGSPGMPTREQGGPSMGSTPPSSAGVPVAKPALERAK
jgi:hypothetical protein